MRVLPLSEAVCALLDARGKEEKGDYVFTPDNRKIGRYWVNHPFQRYVKKLGLKKHLTFHSLRQCHTSWLALCNVSIYQISKLLWHGDVKVTQKHYAHLESKSKSVATKPRRPQCVRDLRFFSSFS